MSNIISFYENKKVKNCRHILLDTLLNGNKWFEYTHDYIQWLFPLDEKSSCNKDAPVLSPSDIVYFKMNNMVAANFECSMIRFIHFLGLGLENGFSNLNNPTFKIVNKKQLYTWKEMNHNSLRITRFLASSTIFGHFHFANNLFVFLRKNLNNKHPSMHYWEDALNGINRNLKR